MWVIISGDVNKSVCCAVPSTSPYFHCWSVGTCLDCSLAPSCVGDRRDQYEGDSTDTGIQRLGLRSHLCHQLKVTSGALVPREEGIGILEGTVVGCVWLLYAM